MYFQGDAIWVDAVYGVELLDAVKGGADGPANRGVKDLVNRTRYLKKRCDDLDAALAAALGNWTLGDIPSRVTTLEAALRALTPRVTAVELKATTLQNSYSDLETRVVALEARPMTTDFALTTICI